MKIHDSRTNPSVNTPVSFRNTQRIPLPSILDKDTREEAPKTPKATKIPPLPKTPKPAKTPISEDTRAKFKLFFFITLCVLIVSIGTLVGVTVGLLNQYLDQLPKISYLEDYRPRMVTRMFSGDESHQLVADFFEDGQNRKVTPLADIPENLKNAVIALEDYEFYDHPGISPRGFIRAAIVDIQRGNFSQGGSTLTMQLAEDLIKNRHLDYELPSMGLKSIQQKVAEIFLALQIEKRFTKNEILEIYLNQVFMGGNIYGVAAAAEDYFDKEISDLSLKECALFAGMLQRPNKLSPSKYPEAAQRRTEIVLDAMLRRGFITLEQFEQAKNEPFQLSSNGVRRTQIAMFPYFSEAVRRQFKDKKIKTGEDALLDILGQGIDIESTLNVPLQQAAEVALKHGIEKHEHERRTKGGKMWGVPGYNQPNIPGETVLKLNEEYDAKILSDYDPQEGTIQVTVPNIKDGKGPFTVSVVPDETWLDEFDLLHKNYFVRVKAYQEGNQILLKLAKDEYVQGSLICVRPSTGEVLAQVGGYDFNDKMNAGQFIRSVQATSLQPGSAFKPLLYTAALADKDKKWMITSTLKDIAREYWAGWTPRNFYDQYYGNVTMIYSLTHSLNAASVWLLDNYRSTRNSGIENLRSFCKNVFEMPIEESNLSIALGTTGTTPMEIAQAYSVLANEGNFVGVHMVNKVYQRRDISRKESNLLYEFKQRAETQPRLSPQVAYLTTYMMRSVVDEGTGKPAKDLPFYCVGKTGTTDDCTYAWFAGYSKDILCIVYMGYDDFKRSLGRKMTGAKVALPIWIEFMQKAYEIQPDLFGDIDPPEGIVFKNICMDSGAIASAECRNTQKLPFEKGVEPRGECPLHGRDTLRPYQNETNRFILSDSTQIQQ